MTDIRSVLKDHIVGLRHIGLIVADLAHSVAQFQRIYGLDAADIHLLQANDDVVPARFALVNVAGSEFELIEPVSPEMKSLLNSVASGGGGINHVAFQVSDIDAALAALAAQDIYPGHVTPDGVVNTGRSRIAYLNPQQTGDMLIELVQSVEQPL